MNKELENLKDVIDSNILSGYSATPKGFKGGKWVQKLEKQFADYHKIKYALALSSGTSALFTAIKACGLGRGDTIYTTPVTFSATASVILWAGCKLKFFDIDRKTYNLNTGKCDKVVMPVHLMGNPCPLTGYVTIEDCCQALGAEYYGHKVGTLCDVGCFSFNQGKFISSGEGGMLITNNDQIAQKASMIRNHGEVFNDVLGFNFRMTELQAAVASARFERLDETVDHVRKLALRLTEMLYEVKQLRTPVETRNCKHTYNYYALRCVGINRDLLQRELLKEGIYFGEGGYKPLYLLPAYKTKDRFPNADKMYREVMFTNILRPPMTLERVEEIGRVIIGLVEHMS